MQKDKFETQHVISYLINFLMITGFVFAILNPSTAVAQINADRKPDSQNPLEIMQGDLIHHFLAGGEALSFTLDVKSPESETQYLWEVQQPPMTGEVLLTPVGAQTKVTYKSDPEYIGDDLFEVRLTSSKGQEAKISVILTIESRSPDMPQQDRDNNPEANQDPNIDNKLPPTLMDLFNDIEDVRNQLNEARQDTQREDSPTIYVDLTWNTVAGFEWAPNTEMTLTIGDDTWTEESDQYGTVWFSLDAFEVQPGHTVTLTDGVNTRTYVVANLAVIEINEDADTLSGTADPNQEVEVYADDGNSWDFRYPAADDTGQWTADFSGSVDFGPGTYGWVVQYDADGNSTVLSWRIPDPSIHVGLMWNTVDGVDWSANAEVTLTIGENTWTEESGPSGYVWFGLDDFEIQPGQTVTMTDGEYTRTHVVANLAVTEIDEEADTLSGTADPNQEVIAEAADDNNFDERYQTADSVGHWTADFSGSVDIGPGAWGYIYQFDSEGNSTYVYWEIPNPHLRVYSNWNEVDGYNWSPNTEVTLKIGSYIWKSRTNSNGSVWFYNLDPFEIQPGQTVTMTDGLYTRTHVVANLAVTEINEDADTLSGTADSNQDISVSANDGSLWDWRYPTTDNNGQWTADFSGSVDLGPGAYGYAYQWDANGNSTRVYWFVPDPSIGIDLFWNTVYGNKWSPNADVTLNIGNNSWTKESSSDGWVYFSLDPFEIQPGQSVTMSDGEYTRTYVVANLAVTDINEETDTLSGTADPNQEVEVYANGDWKNPTADNAGQWTADFSGSVDIGPGASGWVRQNDNNGNYTRLNWRILNPNIRVFFQANNVYGDDWSSNAQVTLSIGDNHWTEISNQDGWVAFYLYSYDIQPGDTVSMTDGVNTETHVVADLAVTEINEISDTLSGTADPNQGVSVLAIHDTSMFGQIIYTTADNAGQWTADFSGTFDITTGAWGYVYQYDGDGNSTQIYWFVPDPSLDIYIDSNTILGGSWIPNIEVTLSINNQQWTGKTDYSGFVYFDTTPFDILPDQTITMTDGVHILTHKPWQIEITHIDYNNNLISGIVHASDNRAASELPGYIIVRACNRTGCLSQQPTVDDQGNWQADYGGVMDFGSGTSGYVTSEDGTKTKTRITFRINATYLPMIVR